MGKKVTRINIAIILVGIILLYFVLILLVEIQRREILHHEIDVMVRNAGRELQSWLETYIDTAQNITNMMELYEDIPVETRRPYFNSLLEQTLKKTPGVFGVWSLWEPNALDGLDGRFAGRQGSSPDGRFAPWWVRINREIIMDTCTNYDLDSIGAYYQTPKNTSKDAIDAPAAWHVGGEKIEILKMSSPIMKAGKFVGAVGIDLETSAIQSKIMELRPYTGSVTALYSEKGIVYAHSDTSHIGMKMEDTEREWAGKHLTDLSLSVHRGQSSSFVNYVPDLKKRMFFVSVPFFIGKSTTFWTLMVGVPDSIIIEPLARMFIAGFFISIILIAVVVALNMVNIFSIRKPVTHMMQAFNNIENSEDLLKKKPFMQLLPRYITRQEDVMANIDFITKSAKEGKLHARAETESLKGNYLLILKGLNAAMDIICDQFDAVPNPIALLNWEHVLVYRNHAFADFCAAQKLEEKDPQFLDKLLAATPHTDWKKMEEDKICVEGVFSLDPSVTCYRSDIVMRDHRYTLMLQRAGTPDNSDLRVMLLLTDVTDITKAKIAAETASKAKGDFLSRMSHEIRTPLNAVTGMTEIASKTDDIAKIRTCLAQITQSSKHLIGVINDILDFSKLEAGKISLESVEFSLMENISFVMSMMQSKAAEKNITMQLEMGDIDNDRLVTDPLRLNQVLINLLSNAIKFSPEGADILLIVKEIERNEKIGESVYYFEVIDHGIGISAEQETRLFQPFEQADGGTARAYGGTGLGLAISRTLVNMMGGEIRLKSRKGHGSSFSFMIRCPSSAKSVESDNALSMSADESLPDFSGKRCLVVDDIAINREIVIELLNITGCEMENAENGQEALDLFTQNDANYYDAILMDMQMPVMDGCSATMKIRALNRVDAKTIPIIAMTANVTQEDALKTKQAGMNAHVGKPIDIAELITVLKSFF